MGRGGNSDGQLGNGEHGGGYERAPIQVLCGEQDTTTGYLENIVDIDAGARTSIACDENGNVWTWGDNEDGQLGNDTYTDTDLPVQVHDGEMNTGSGYLENIVAVATSADQFNTSYALDADGCVWAWGYNQSGELGNDTRGLLGSVDTPVQVHDGEMDTGSGYLEDIVAICAGANHAFALDENGNLWAWGGGNNGVLGQNSTSDKDTPVKVKDSAGTTQNPALKTQH